MIFSEALFDAAQASLMLTSNRRFAPKSSPLISFVHCLAGRAGQARPNYSLKPTRDNTMAKAQHLCTCGLARIR